ncbi:MAG: DHH family phosphoesterase [Candidatus Absconditabacterales bacterium]|nr:DHH family phosphoesterase [Candidatus Absconditabacterales bacterium]
MRDQSLHPDELLSFINQHDSFAIFGHEYVDGDAWGSMVGLGEALRSMGKSVTLFLTHQVPAGLDILHHACPTSLEIDETQHYDAVIFVDFSPLSRITKFLPHQEWILSHPLAIIDHHHEPNPLDIAVYHKDNSACSTCILIADFLLTYTPSHMNASIANALLMGIMTDTGNFLFPGNYENIFHISIALIKAGAQKEELTQKLFRSRSRASIQCSQQVLQRAVLGEGFAWSWMHRDERVAFGIDKQESKMGMNILASVEGVGCVIYFDLTPTEWKLHMRSKKLDNGEHISCAKITALFGGGGHHCAAGATIVVDQRYHIGDISCIPKEIGPAGLVQHIINHKHHYTVDHHEL